ncbi:MAG: hypothetical protein VB138_08800, partial [Burkholderia sp.]
AHRLLKRWPPDHAAPPAYTRLDDCSVLILDLCNNVLRWRDRVAIFVSSFAVIVLVAVDWPDGAIVLVTP